MIQITKNPIWEDRFKLLERPQQEKEIVDNAVKEIVRKVREQGDDELYAFARAYDKANLTTLKVTSDEIQAAALEVNDDLKKAIQIAYNNIYKFHQSCFTKDYAPIQTTPGITCWRKSLPIDKVGLYIPGGSAPLFSTVLMLGIPAQIAGNRQVILCSPTGASGKIHPAILYTANLCGITEIYKAGGAGAIAAMTYGTKSIPAVDKIFGPGNAYVTRAKELAQQSGIAIDMPAGPSEVLVVADHAANPEFVAADLLAQAEHEPDSQVILLTDSLQLAKEVNKAVESQLNMLSRKLTAQKALENSRIIVLENIDECIKWSDAYAPEHLIINTNDAEQIAEKINIAGSVFIGAYTCESLGDYASGTNHTLPTYGYARNYSGVSVDSFVNKVTFQKASKNGIKNLGPAVQIMAGAEGLDGHENAVAVRLRSLRANPQSMHSSESSFNRRVRKEGELHSISPSSSTYIDGVNPEPIKKAESYDKLSGREKYEYETARRTIYGTVKERVYHMRKNPTEAEAKLWERLRNKKAGHKFRRQHIIDKYIVDFASLENKVIIEVDGGIHELQKHADVEREEFLNNRGFKVIRFGNREVLENINEVITEIMKEVEKNI